MYKIKSEILEQIQSYHKQVSELYEGLYEKIEDNDMKVLIHDLYKHEKHRENYLEKHKKIAEAMNCYLEFPCEKLSDQINDCFKNINTTTELNMEELIRIEMYFDNCLIKLYNILASEDKLSETEANIFYYMLKKTKKEESTLSNMLHHARNNLHYGFSLLNA